MGSVSKTERLFVRNPMKTKLGMVRPLVVFVLPLSLYSGSVHAELVNEVKCRQALMGEVVSAAAQKSTGKGSSGEGTKKKGLFGSIGSFISNIVMGDPDNNPAEDKKTGDDKKKKEEKKVETKPERTYEDEYYNGWGYSGGYRNYYGDYKPKELTPEEKAEQERLRKERLEREEKARQARLEAERKQAEELKARLEAADPNDPLYRDFKENVYYKKIKDIVKREKAYVFLIGNAHSGVDPKVAKEVEKMIYDVIRNEHILVYDADSAYAPIFQRIGGNRALGISGRADAQGENVVSITNPYMRAEIFTAGKEVIHTPDSLTGLGALMLGIDKGSTRYNFRTLDVHQQWSQGLVDFGKSFRPEIRDDYYGDETGMVYRSPKTSRVVIPEPPEQKGVIVTGRREGFKPEVKTAKPEVTEKATVPVEKESGMFRWAKNKDNKTTEVPVVADAAGEDKAGFELDKQSDDAKGFKGRSYVVKAEPQDPRPRNLGLSFGESSRTSVITSGSQFDSSRGFFSLGGSAPWNIDFKHIVSTRMNYDLLSDFRWSSGHIDVLAQISDVTKDETYIPGGSVVFGSSGSSVFDPELKAIVKSLAEEGSSIRHGGAGGAMRVAAEGAKDGGGKSIGIPISGRNSLKAERETARDVQDLTLETDGYEARISGLLYGTGLVMIAPGGSGTMREVAATFMRAAVPSENPSLIMLASKNYYQKLYDFYQALPIPEAIKSNVKIVDTPEQAKAAVEDWKAKH